MFCSPQITNFSVEYHHSTKIITVTTVLPHHIYRPHGITVKFSPSPQ